MGFVMDVMLFGIVPAPAAVTAFVEFAEFVEFVVIKVFL